MKKSLLLAALLCALALAGCGEKQAEGGLTGIVNTDGSTSMADVMAVLQEAFREKYPNVTVNYSGTGSGAGVEAALSGSCDIGLSSRNLQREESEQGAAAYVIALDAVAVVVNPARALEDLTLERLRDIFTGRVASWEQLGCGEGPIAVYGREAGSGTRTAFEDLAGVTDQCAYTNIYGSTGDVVGNVSANPNAIGYASLASLGAGVRAVTIEGVPCTEETVRDGDYLLRRPFLMVVKRGAALGEAVKSFLEFAQSSEAEEYIALTGAIAP